MVINWKVNRTGVRGWLLTSTELSSEDRALCLPPKNKEVPMTLAVKADTFQDAVFEARAYERLGSLDDKVMEDIAFDYNVDVVELRKAVFDD